MAFGVGASDHDHLITEKAVEEAIRKPPQKSAARATVEHGKGLGIRSDLSQRGVDCPAEDLTQARMLRLVPCERLLQVPGGGRPN